MSDRKDYRFVRQKMTEASGRHTSAILNEPRKADLQAMLAEAAANTAKLQKQNGFHDGAIVGTAPDSVN